MEKCLWLVICHVGQITSSCENRPFWPRFIDEMCQNLLENSSALALELVNGVSSKCSF